MKDKRLTDVEVVNEFKAGAVEAFEEIIARYESKVMGSLCDSLATKKTLKR